MRSAANVHIHCFWTGAFDIAHRTLQHFGTLALFRLPLDVLRFRPGLRAEPTMFFCETLVQLRFSGLHLNPLFLSL